MATRITKEWRLPTGHGPDGRLETIAVGFRVEDDFGIKTPAPRVERVNVIQLATAA